jgi:hypothetical protein
MQELTTGKRFLFHGHAIAAAGKITSPFQDIIPAQAASALSSSGGYGSERAGEFRYKEIFSFASAYTQVVGTFVEKNGGAYETLSLTAIEKVNIMDVVTCDRVVGRITAKYPADGSTATVSIAGSRFERLRVGDRFFEKLDLPADLLANYDASEKSSYAAAGAGDKTKTPEGDKTAEGGEEYPPDVLYDFRPISIPHFGDVFLGEHFAFPNLRHLIMLRVSLGCPVGGTVNVGGAVSGGDPYP